MEKIRIIRETRKQRPYEIRPQNLSEAGGFSHQWQVNSGSTAKAMTLISPADQNTLYLCNISSPVQLFGDLHRVHQRIKHPDTIKYRK
jgi:hypothetical protein